MSAAATEAELARVQNELTVLRDAVEPIAYSTARLLGVWRGKPDTEYAPNSTGITLGHLRALCAAFYGTDEEEPA